MRRVAWVLLSTVQPWKKPAVGSEDTGPPGPPDVRGEW